MKKKFYIFLDIDGVLWDKKFVESKKINFNQIKKIGFDKNSIVALNSLLSFLKDNFEPIIVISSSWRIIDSNFDLCKKLLEQGGLEYFGEIQKTPLGFARGGEISKFLKRNKEKENYVIIDDSIEDIIDFGHLDSKKIIKTDLENGDLNANHIQSFLERFDEIYLKDECKL